MWRCGRCLYEVNMSLYRVCVMVRQHKRSAHERNREYYESGEWSTGQKWADDAPKDDVDPECVSLISSGACGAFVHGLEDEFLGTFQWTVNTFWVLLQGKSRGGPYSRRSVGGCSSPFHTFMSRWARQFVKPLGQSVPPSCVVSITGWSRMVIKQFQDGGRPPFLKSLYRHISAKNHPIFMKFCTQQQIWTGWTSRDQKWKSCIGQTASSAQRISCS